MAKNVETDRYKLIYPHSAVRRVLRNVMALWCVIDPMKCPFSFKAVMVTSEIIIFQVYINAFNFRQEIIIIIHLYSAVVP